jgi:Sec-independent protein secretion pathway component TatC
MFTEVSEAIWLEVSLALLTTSFCLSPLVFYQGLSFFSPSWYHSQRLFYWKMGIALWLTSLGLILLSFLWLLPEICLFFLQFEFHVGLYFEPRIWSFLSFLWRFLFVEIFCWFSFVGINLWLEMYTIDLKQKKTRSLGWLMSLFLGALVSPPEVVFQLSLSLCFGLLYEFLFFLRLYRQNCYSKKYKNSKTLCKAS